MTLALSFLLSACAPSPREASAQPALDRSAPAPAADTSTSGTDTSTAGTDTSTTGTESASSAGPPPFPCPEPPKGAVVVPTHGYLGDAEVFNWPTNHSVHLHLQLISYPSARCLYAPDFSGPAYAGAPGAYVTELTIDSPLENPRAVQGFYRHPAKGPGLVNYSVDLWQYTAGVRQDWSTRRDAGLHASARLCISRYSEDRLAGTILLTPNPGDTRGLPVVYQRFDVRPSDPTDMPAYDDGSCFHYSYFGIDAATLWSPGYTAFPDSGP